MKAPPPLIVALLLAAFATSGCGKGGNGSNATLPNPHVPFPKSNYILHTGLAFGAFHRYVSEPLKAGSFGASARRREPAIVRGGAAALFAVHELKAAREDALSDAHLRPLARRVERLLRRFSHLGISMRRGSVSAQAITSTDYAVGALVSASRRHGATIREIPPRL